MTLPDAPLSRRLYEVSFRAVARLLLAASR
ncbi:MAG: hypothetical protein QOE54_1958 [Streptosporangiaceae bacterium]|jgi:hypothetical protein|nr:hypothetical protein [Streptosporangiaceae bacterium]